MLDSVRHRVVPVHGWTVHGLCSPLMVTWPTCSLTFIAASTASTARRPEARGNARPPDRSNDYNLPASAPDTARSTAPRPRTNAVAAAPSQSIPQDAAVSVHLSPRRHEKRSGG